MAAHVIPGPTVEAALLDGGDIIGDKVIAKVVALVCGAPELTGDGIDGFADTIADARGINLDELAFGSELENVGTVKLPGVGVSVVYV
jgi:hypothetical protein